MDKSRICALCVAAAFCAWTAHGADTWTEDTFADFADGSFDDAGQNLYVSGDGAIRSIHRFDLNHDGWIDLLFNNTHDLIGILPSTLGYIEIDGVVRAKPLAVEGALRVTPADMNRDGWLDLVFCPNRQGIQHPRRFVTVIYGGSDGWPASRSNGLLPVHGAADLAVVDLNGDSWPDITVLNAAAWLPGQPQKGRIVRVYWGGEQGFLLTRFRDYGVEHALDMAAADFNGDEAADLAILQSTGHIFILPSTTDADGPDSESVEVITLPDAQGTCLTTGDLDNDGRADVLVGCRNESMHIVLASDSGGWTSHTVTAFPATHAATGDLDGDGLTDCILTESAIAHAAGGEAIGAEAASRKEVRVLWGDEAGFARDRSTELSAPYATASAVGDVNGDGHADLAVAVYQSREGTFTANSYIFPGKGDRQFIEAIPGPEVTGATDVAIAPPEGELPARMVFANSQGGHVDERIALDLYWGGPDGFSTQRHRGIPFASGYEATAADFNGDGNTDLLAICSGHAGGSAAEAMTQLGANIFWGNAKGVNLDEQPTVLREYNLYSSNTADLDKDGYLDIVLGAFAPPPEQETELLVIYHGSASGFSAERRTAIPAPGRSSICAIADLNGDSWLDIGVTSYVTDCARIYWGGPEGFSEDRQQQLAIPKPIELETADLNADGWLDLVVGSYQDPVANHSDTGLLVFWGGPAGFAEWNAQWLPGYTPVGLTIADWDADGHLDLLSTHYHGEVTREQLPSYLYWGSADGFATRNRTVFTANSPSDALAADFDRDGLLDVAISNHTRDGDHAAMSQVFYNDGNRFKQPRLTELPTVGAHWMWTEDMGHIAHRKFAHVYTSSIFDWDHPTSGGTIEVTAKIPEGATLDVAIRAAGAAEGLDEAPWHPVTGGQFPLESGDRVLQYKAAFRSDNGDRFPVLDRVRIEVNP